MRNRKKKAMISLMLLVLFFIGLIAVTMAIPLFAKTVVSWKLFVSIFLLTGVLMTPFTSAALEHYGECKTYFLKIFYNVAAFGGVLIGLLTGLNYYAASMDIRRIKGKIKEIGYEKSRGRNTYPYAAVEINGTIKDIRFPYNFELNGYKYVEVSLKKGLLGFDIIVYGEALVDR